MAGCHQTEGDRLCRPGCLERLHRLRRRRHSIFADLVAIAGTKHGIDAGVPEAVRDRSKPKISIHADEVNEMMNNPCPAADKAGGAGVQVTAYTQTWSDIVARLGDSAKAGQVMGTTTP
ncbi:MAG: hypothetical protein ACOYMG_25590 [Candidatus Methylumidiphilus sp.]